MALKRLLTGEMISISAPWIERTSGVRKLIEAIPTAAGTLPHLEAAHQGVLGTQAATMSAGMANIIKEEDVKDARHDSLVMGLDSILAGFALIAKDPADGARLLDIRQKLLPEGVAVTHKSLREESGQAKKLEQRLTAEDRAFLKKLPVPSGKLNDVVDEWLAIAAELGSLEDRKDAEAAKQALAGAGGEMVAARNKWIRAANALVSMLELADVDDNTMVQILGPLREMERKADRRGSRKNKGTEAELAATNSDSAKP